MSGRITISEWALELALVTAKRSTCLRRSVGCVLLDDKNHILATGYNGVASGQPHCNEVQLVNDEFMTPYACPGAKAQSGTMLDSCYAVHAEQNALLQCQDVYTIKTCVVTVSPCVTCIKLLLNTSCRVVMYMDTYAYDNISQRLWLDAGRQFICLSASV